MIKKYIIKLFLLLFFLQISQISVAVSNSFFPKHCCQNQECNQMMLKEPQLSSFDEMTGHPIHHKAKKICECAQNSCHEILYFNSKILYSFSRHFECQQFINYIKLIVFYDYISNKYRPPILYV